MQISCHFRSRWWWAFCCCSFALSILTLFVIFAVHYRQRYSSIVQNPRRGYYYFLSSHNFAVTRSLFWHTHSTCTCTYTLKLFSLSLSCILLYFCFISCFALHTQHKTCYCSFDALLSAVQCMCAFQPLSFQYRTTMMHFSLLKHTQHSCTFFSRFLSPNFGSCTFACFGSPCATSRSLFSRYSCWCSVILVCFFFLLIVVVVVCLR